MLVLVAAHVLLRAPALLDPVFQDEWVALVNLRHFAATRWLAPAVPEWPPLYSYLCAPLVALSAVVGGALRGVGPMDWLLLGGAFLDPAVVLGNRLLALALGAAVVPVLWRSLPAGAGRAAVVGTVAVYTLSPVSVEYGAMGLPETGVMLGAAVAVWQSLVYVETGGRRALVWAGVGAALAAAMKYHGGLVCVACAAAAVARARAGGSWRVPLADLAAAGLVSLGAFLVLTPTVLLDAQGTLGGLLFQRDHLSTPRVGPNYTAYWGTPWFLLTREPGWLLGAGVGIVLALRGGGARVAVMMAPVVANFAIVGSWARMDPNYWVPALPAAALLVGEALHRMPQMAPRAAAVGTTVLAAALLVIAPPSWRPSNERRMREWLVENLPADAVVARDGAFTVKVWTPKRVEEFLGGAGARLSPAGRALFEERLARSPRAAGEVILLEALAREPDRPLASHLPPGAWLLTTSLPMERVLKYPEPPHPKPAAAWRAQKALYDELLRPAGAWELVHREAGGSGQAHLVFRHRGTGN
jgi:hypothetical protein